MKWIARLVLVGLLSAVANAATAAPEPPGDAAFGSLTLDRSAALRNGESAAVAALVEAAQRELAAARPEQAAARLERALRIEPHNAALWHYLGLVYLELGKYAQAEAMAAKSRSLAGANRTLRRLNASLTAAALQAQGKPVRPANDAPLLASQTPPDTAVERAAAYVDREARRARQLWSSIERIPPAIRGPSAARQGDAVERGRLERERAGPQGDCPAAARRLATFRCETTNGQAERRASSGSAEQRSTQRTERTFNRRYGWRTGVEI